MQMGSASSSTSVPAEAQVAVMKKQAKQEEAVMNTLLQGMNEASARSSAYSTGQRLNVTA
jgi:hypothetical protein